MTDEQREWVNTILAWSERGFAESCSTTHGYVVAKGGSGQSAAHVEFEAAAIRLARSLVKQLPTVKLVGVTVEQLEQQFRDLQGLSYEFIRKVESCEPVTLGEALSLVQCIGITQGVLSEHIRKQKA